MTPPRRVVVEADGGARGNPGPAGYGALVCAADSGEVLAERSESLGEATNNVAEYSGLIAGLSAAAELGAAEVEVRMDSKLVVEQMSGRWQIKHPGLRPLAAKAAALVRQFDSVAFHWIPRSQNTRADALANAAMDAAAGIAPAVPAAPVSAAPAPVRAVPAAPAAAAAVPASWEPPSGTPTRLILVRHGETAMTAEGRYSGRGDVPLTPRGQAQANAVAERVAKLPIAAVATSPLSRCVATAQAISAVREVPVVTEPELIECDFGAWEGRRFAEVRERWPEEMQAWLASPAVAPPDGESFEAVAARVGTAVARLRAAYPAQTVAVVSHVSPIKLLLRDALAASDAFLHRLFLDPCGLSIVDYYADGGIAVRAVNDTAHLD